MAYHIFAYPMKWPLGHCKGFYNKLRRVCPTALCRPFLWVSWHAYLQNLILLVLELVIGFSGGVGTMQSPFGSSQHSKFQRSSISECFRASADALNLMDGQGKC